MATIPNNITNATQVQFQLSANRDKLGTPAAGTIVFIKESKELYLDGVYYGLSTAAAEELSNATSNISKLNTNFSAHLQLTNGLVDYVKNLRKFADGATDNSPEGPVLETSEGVLVGITNVKAAIKKLDEVVTTLNAHVWTAVNKPTDATGKFVTSVTQDTHGSIHVDYEYVKSTDVKRTEEQKAIVGGDTVEDALQTLKRNLDTTNQNVSNNASAIDIIKGPADKEGSIANAVKKAKEELIGTGSGVWLEGEDEKKTLTYLRELIKTNAGQIASLTGLDEQKTTQITNIIKELTQITDSEQGDFANTLLDKLLTLYGSPTGGKYTVNGVTDQTTLQGIINKIEDEISAGDSEVTGKITTEINNLNATVKDQLAQDADTVVAGKHVGVKVIETKGKLTEVKVVEKDIASDKDLSALKQEVSGIKTTVEEHGRQLKWKVIS